MIKFVIVFTLILASFFAFQGWRSFYTQNFTSQTNTPTTTSTSTELQTDLERPKQESKISFTQPGNFKLIPQKLHIFQTFNNCGPATLSMALSYTGINVSQQELGQKLRPYQNPQGDNDDKSVTLQELAQEAENYNLVSFHRPNGTIELLKTFTANDIPVVVRTWLNSNDDIGHYRIVRGFDENTKEIIQDDSYQGKNLRFGYDEFLSLWQPFNYEYLIIVPKEKRQIVENILGEEVNEQVAWQNARDRAQVELQNDNTVYPQFNLSVSYYHLGEYQKSIEAFEKIQNKLPFRMLWYQIEPIEAYLKVKNYQKVFSLTGQILNNHNRAFTELYILRGQSYQEQGDNASAKAEYEKAVFYNKNSQIAQEALERLSS